MVHQEVRLKATVVHNNRHLHVAHPSPHLNKIKKLHNEIRFLLLKCTVNSGSRVRLKSMLNARRFNSILNCCFKYVDSYISIFAADSILKAIPTNRPPGLLAISTSIAPSRSFAPFMIETTRAERFHQTSNDED